jgi:hypothetical protein
MSRDRNTTILVGLGLIGVGLVLVLAQWIGWEKIWPLFPLLGGLGFLVGYVASGFKEAGFVFVGTAASLIGLFFFGFSLGYWEWADMAQLWPVFPFIGGGAFLAMFLADRAHDVGVLGVGCAAMIVGIVGLGITFGLLGGDILKLWPLLLVLMGLIGLVGAVVQTLRRK